MARTHRRRACAHVLAAAAGPTRFPLPPAVCAGRFALAARTQKVTLALATQPRTSLASRPRFLCTQLRRARIVRRHICLPGGARATTQWLELALGGGTGGGGGRRGKVLEVEQAAHDCHTCASAANACTPAATCTNLAGNDNANRLRDPAESDHCTDTHNERLKTREGEGACPAGRSLHTAQRRWGSQQPR